MCINLLEADAVARTNGEWVEYVFPIVIIAITREPVLRNE